MRCVVKGNYQIAHIQQINTINWVCTLDVSLKLQVNVWLLDYVIYWVSDYNNVVNVRQEID